MSFQLSIGADVVMPVAVKERVGALTTATAAGLAICSRDDYTKFVAAYQRDVATHEKIDAVSAERRRELDLRASALRTQFEQLGIKLTELKGDYNELGTYDTGTHDRRETSYDALVAKFSSIPSEDREGVHKPPYFASRVNANDTSSCFRDADGKLKGPITSQVVDRTPDWLDTLTDVVCAAVEGWDAAALGLELDSSKCTNNLQRSRRALAEVIHDHAVTHANTTWRPAVMLAHGETVAQHVKCAFDWNDMYTPGAAETPLATTIDMSVDLSNDTVVMPADGPDLVAPTARRPQGMDTPLGTYGLNTLSVETLTEIGNRVETQLRADTVKQIATPSADELDARVRRLAGVGAWYSK
jgi:hypothetical protein